MYSFNAKQKRVEACRLHPMDAWCWNWQREASQFVSWCFASSPPQRVISRLVKERLIKLSWMMVDATQRDKYCHFAWCSIWNREADIAIFNVAQRGIMIHTAILYDAEYDTERQTLPPCMRSMTQRGKHCHLVWCWVWYREANTAILYDVEYDTERQTMPSCMMLSMTQRGKHCHLVWCKVWHREANTATLFSSVQFSPLTDWVIGWTLWTIQQRSSPSRFCRRPLLAVLAWAVMSILWCPSSIPLYIHTPHTPLPSSTMLNMITQRGKQFTAILYDVEYDRVTEMNVSCSKHEWRRKHMLLTYYEIICRKKKKKKKSRRAFVRIIILMVGSCLVGFCSTTRHMDWKETIGTFFVSTRTRTFVFDFSWTPFSRGCINPCTITTYIELSPLIQFLMTFKFWSSWWYRKGKITHV